MKIRSFALHCLFLPAVTLLACPLAPSATPAGNQDPTMKPTAVYCMAGDTFAEKLAAREIRRYIYLRTGSLLPVAVTGTDHPLAKPALGSFILIGDKDRPEISTLAIDAACKAAITGWQPQQYLLKTTVISNNKVLLVIGGDPAGTLYGAYAVAEKLGVRFYLLGDTFSCARMLGIKTCIGTETPLVIPAVVKQRLQAAGKNPADPAVVQELYEGMFQRIAKVQPLDYYWLWTPEGWTWGAVNQQQIDATMADFRACMAAAKNAKAPFTLATCGWVLGPPQTNIPEGVDGGQVAGFPNNTIVGNTTGSNQFPAAALKSDFEYYVQASLGQHKLLFPATGPALPQTVVVCAK